MTEAYINRLLELANRVATAKDIQIKSDSKSMIFMERLNMLLGYIFALENIAQQSSESTTGEKNE